MKPVFSLLITQMLLLTAGFSTAEVYRWADENGKVHFSDRKPAANTGHVAEDISEQVKNTNIDSSTKSRQQMRSLFAEETEEEESLRNKQLRQAGQQQQRSCNESRRYLKIIRGRFHYVDKDGRQSDISQAEQKKLIAKTERYIKKHCS